MPLPRPFPLPAADVAWLRMERPTNPMTITGVVGFGGPMPLATLRAFVEERIVPFNRFRMRVDGVRSLRPRWVPDEDFSLDRHILRADLPAPGGKAGLEALVGELMSTPISFEHSPWTFHIVDGVDDGHGHEGSAAIVRIHHCVADGIALMHVLLAAADEYFDSAAVVGPRPRDKRPLRQRAARTARGAAGEAFDLLTRPSHLGDRLGAIGAGSKALADLLLMSPDSDTVLKGDGSADKRAAWTGPIPLERIRAIGAQMDAKINDVLLAAAAGAIRRYLLDRGEPVDGVEVRVAVPVNVRPLERANELGNSFALVFLPLPVSVDTPEERLAELKRRMDEIKDSAQPAVVYGILQSIGRSPKWAHRLVVKMFSEKTSGVMTNVPGPAETIHFKGVPVETIMFWVPQAGDIGLGVSIFSYDGAVRVGVCADHAYVPDPAVLSAAFEAEVEALAERFGAERFGAEHEAPVEGSQD